MISESSAFSFIVATLKHDGFLIFAFLVEGTFIVRLQVSVCNEIKYVDNVSLQSPSFFRFYTPPPSPPPPPPKKNKRGGLIL